MILSIKSSVCFFTVSVSASSLQASRFCLSWSRTTARALFGEGRAPLVSYRVLSVYIFVIQCNSMRDDYSFHVLLSACAWKHKLLHADIDLVNPTRAFPVKMNSLLKLPKEIHRRMVWTMFWSTCHPIKPMYTAYISKHPEVGLESSKCTEVQVLEKPKKQQTLKE